MKRAPRLACVRACTRTYVRACLDKREGQAWPSGVGFLHLNHERKRQTSGGLASSFVRWEHAVPPGPESSGGGTNQTNGRWPPLPPGFLISPQLPELINTGRIAAGTLCFPSFTAPPPPVFPPFHAYFCVNREARKVEVMEGVRTVERPHKLYLVFYEFQISYVS